MKKDNSRCYTCSNYINYKWCFTPTPHKVPCKRHCSLSVLVCKFTPINPNSSIHQFEFNF